MELEEEEEVGKIAYKVEVAALNTTVFSIRKTFHAKLDFSKVR